MHRLTVAGVIVLLVGAVNCFANLVPTALPVGTNLIPNSGSGYGNVLTLLNAQDKNDSDGLEANCGVAPFSGGNATEACSGPFSSLTLNDPANQNQVQTIGASGITNASTAASQLLLIFNINQQGSSDAILLQNIGLALWDASGNLLFGTLSARSDEYTPIEQGIGTAGFGYKLDSGQAAAAQTAINTYLAANTTKTLSDIFVTGAFQAGCPPGTACANDGAETLFLGAQGSTVVVPDGGITLMLLGGALVGLETLRRRIRA
jgi:hypothetical protein